MKSDLYVGKSVIAGKGVYTSSPIKKGATAFILKGAPIKWVVTNKETADSGPNWVGVGKNQWVDPAGIYQYLNHSCSPNLGIKGKVTFVAMRNIAANEELTFDYSVTEETLLWSVPGCRCGSKRCRGTIRSIQYLPKKTYQRYLPLVPSYFQKVYASFLKQKKVANQHG